MVRAAGGWGGSETCTCRSWRRLCVSGSAGESATRGRRGERREDDLGGGDDGGDALDWWIDGWECRARTVRCFAARPAGGARWRDGELLARPGPAPLCPPSLSPTTRRAWRLADLHTEAPARRPHARPPRTAHPRQLALASPSDSHARPDHPLPHELGTSARSSRAGDPATSTSSSTSSSLCPSRTRSPRRRPPHTARGVAPADHARHHQRLEQAPSPCAHEGHRRRRRRDPLHRQRRLGAVRGHGELSLSLPLPLSSRSR